MKKHLIRRLLGILALCIVAVCEFVFAYRMGKTHGEVMTAREATRAFTKIVHLSRPLIREQALPQFEQMSKAVDQESNEPPSGPGQMVRIWNLLEELDNAKSNSP